MSNEDPTPEQLKALEELDQAIRNAWEAFGRSEPTDALADGWKNTPPDERMLTNWVVLASVAGKDEDQIDMLFPHFPALPAWQTKGMLLEAMDQMRGDTP